MNRSLEIYEAQIRALPWSIRRWRALRQTKKAQRWFAREYGPRRKAVAAERILRGFCHPLGWPVIRLRMLWWRWRDRKVPGFRRGEMVEISGSACGYDGIGVVVGRRGEGR